MCRPPREGLESLPVKMGRTGPLAEPRRGPQAGNLGTPVPRTPTVAPGPKARSDLASRRSQRASAERRGPQQPAASVDAWRLMGRGRLRFPMLPRQLPDLTSPCCMQRKPSLPVIMGGAGWPSPAINEEGGRSPRHPSLPAPLASPPLLHCSQQHPWCR